MIAEFRRIGSRMHMAASLAIVSLVNWMHSAVSIGAVTHGSKMQSYTAASLAMFPGIG